MWPEFESIIFLTEKDSFERKQLSQSHYYFNKKQTITHDMRFWATKHILAVKRVTFIVVGVYTFVDVGKLPLGNSEFIFRGKGKVEWLP